MASQKFSSSSENVSQKRQSYLDSIRGIACMLVVLHHLSINIGVRPMVIWGFTGVHTFFVLSGYLLGKPYVRALQGTQSFPSIFPFYLRRFVRIYPPYLAALLTYVGLRYITHSKMPSKDDILLHIALIFNHGQQSSFFSINPAFWSLAIEAQFYLALPLLAGVVYLASARWRGMSAVTVFVAALYVIGVLWRTGEFLTTRGSITPGMPDIVYFRMLPSYLDLFGGGVLVAALETLPSKAYLQSRKASPAVFVLGVITFLLANLWCSVVGHGAWLTVGDFLFTVCFPLLLCSSIVLMLLPVVLRTGRDIPWLNSPALVALGAISYSVYLYHIGIQFSVMKIIHLDTVVRDYDLRNIAYFSLSILPVLAFSFLMYWLVERPCLNYLSKPKKLMVPAQANTLP